MNLFESDSGVGNQNYYFKLAQITSLITTKQQIFNF